MLPNMAPLVHLSPSAITYRSPIAQDKANERTPQNNECQQLESLAEEYLEHSQDEGDANDENATDDGIDETSSSHHSPTPMKNTQCENASSGRIANGTGISQKHFLPAFIKPLPHRFGPTDLAYLAEKDALTIPDDELRNELLRIYIYVVYAFIPCVELGTFLGPILRNNGEEQVSLILFQAIMYVSVTFVDVEYLRARGYPNRKSAQKTFFNRVRLLYGLDCEPDRLVLLQALVLMTYCLRVPSDDLIRLMGHSGLTTLDMEGRKGVALITVDLAKLCICIGHALSSQYSTLGTLTGGSELFSSPTTAPQFSERQALELAKCESELENWVLNRHTICHFKPLIPGRPASHDWCEKMTRLHQALLHLIYLNTTGVLHRPRAFSSATSPINTSDQRKSISKVKEAAIATTKLAFELQSENYFRYLTTSSVPAFLSASLIHLLDVYSPDEETRSASIGRFCQSAQALHQLQEMHMAAESAMRFLERRIKSLGIRHPLLAAIGLFRFGGGVSTDEITNLSAVWGYHQDDQTFPGFMATPNSLSQDPDNFVSQRPGTAECVNLQTTSSPLMSHIFEEFAAETDQLSAPLQMNEDFTTVPQMFSHLGVDGPLPEVIDFDIDPSFF
ncbi:hypothetical protein E8E14_000395 [Neopestalotiopsis sp. 37M]|nr:hypothetical protein E8E14_000395 [Neopestalotiopsis sp. 37M]